MSDLEDGRVYRIHSRNLITGVWVADTQGFIGIREKFGAEYLFEEYHWETGPPFGTASPITALDAWVPVNERTEDSTFLFDLLKRLDAPIVEEIRRRNEEAFQEAESKRWAPQTKAQYDREQAVDKVKAAYRALKEEAMQLPEGDERRNRLQEIHQQWVTDLQRAMKENPA